MYVQEICSPLLGMGHLSVAKAEIQIGIDGHHPMRPFNSAPMSALDTSWERYPIMFDLAVSCRPALGRSLT